METQASTTQVSLAQGIDSAKLERELNAMWAEMSAPAEGAQAAGGDARQAGVVRAGVLPLVVYAGGPEECAGVDELLGDIVERHPCRAIVLAADRDAAEPRLE